MENRKFFGEVGITSTSANHLANMGKEATRKFLNYLSNVQFYTEHLKVIGDPTATLIQEGLTSKDLPDILFALQWISEINALIAYLREAIKEKEKLTKEATDWTDTESRDALKKKRVELVRPAVPVMITSVDIMNEWNVGQLEHYLTLQAKAAAYGKALHEEGTLSRARIDLQEKVTKPRNVQLNGRDTLINEYKPTVKLEDVDSLFFDLQEEFRKTQAELNGMLKSIKDEVETRNFKANQEYTEALRKYNQEDKALDKEEEMISLTEKTTRETMLAEVQKLKIVIPNRLKPIYDKLSAL